VDARRRHLAEAFVELADTLVNGFDIIDFLHLLSRRTAELTDVKAVGLVVTDQRGQLRLVAASTEQTHMLELLELQNEEGPSLDCFRSGGPVRDVRLEAGERRWPRFAPAARDAGFATVDAMPMRLRDQTIGALNLFSTSGGGVADEDVEVAQALADVATIGILSARTLSEHELVAEQLQGTLNSRVLLEQAKGVLAERHGLSMDVAFEVVRDTAHDRAMPLSELAAAVVSGEELLEPPAERETRDR
jgi:transcriptional regulator with GAF, ATPase, and Fis domain